MFSHNPPTSSVQQARVRSAAAVTVSLALAGVLAGAVPTAQATTDRSGASQCRGHGADLNARIRYESDIVIKAPLSTVFKLQTDVERWPVWQSPVLTAKRLTPGTLRKGSQFRWTTPAPATPTTPATTLKI